jgi:anti-anti-sigma factor
MLTISTEDRGHALYVALAGRMDGSPACGSLKNVIQSSLEAGHRRFVVDLGCVISMSSHGIGCLVSSYASVQGAGGSMVLRAPNERVLRALRVTRLVPSVFHVIETGTRAQSAHHA